MCVCVCACLWLTGPGKEPVRSTQGRRHRPGECTSAVAGGRGRNPRVQVSNFRRDSFPEQRDTHQRPSPAEAVAAATEERGG